MATRKKDDKIITKFEMDVERTLNAFTCGTYKVYEALYEFVDNAYDADASMVYIGVEKGDQHPVGRLIIADDGKGMTREMMEQALVFAGQIRERSTTEISEFGVGMKAAAFALANEFVLISKDCEGNIAGAYLNRDQINQSQNYDGPSASHEDWDYKALYEQYAPDSASTGTIVILESVLQVEYKNCASLIKGLRNPGRLATRYRAPIDTQKLSISTINGEKGKRIPIKSRDPLERDQEGTTILVNQAFCWTPKGEPLGDNVKFDFCVTRLKKGGAKEFGIIVKVAGIVVYRDSQSLLGMYPIDTSHSHRWCLRGEIDFATKEDFQKVMAFASHKHQVQVEDPRFSDWLRDGDIGATYTLETSRRKREQEVHRVESNKLSFEAQSDKFVNTLATRKEVFGPFHTALPYFKKITDLQPAKSSCFENSSEIAKLDGGSVKYNMGHVQLASLLVNKHASRSTQHLIGKAVATVYAIAKDLDSTGTPCKWEECMAFLLNLVNAAKAE